MWQYTDKMPNQNTCPLFNIVNTQVLQTWQCIQCMNILYQKISLFSPYKVWYQEKEAINSYKSQLRYQQNIALQNVNIEIKKINQTDIKIKEQFQKIGLNKITNILKVTCRNCNNCGKLKQIGYFFPNFNTNIGEFTYQFVPNLQNIKISKIIYGRMIPSKYSLQMKQKIQKQFKIFPNNVHFHASSHKIFMILFDEIAKYINLWLSNHTLTLNLIPVFIKESNQRKNGLKCMKQLVRKLMSKGKIFQRSKLLNVFNQLNMDRFSNCISYNMSHISAAMSLCQDQKRIDYTQRVMQLEQKQQTKSNLNNNKFLRA